jgi:hypothetical protein
MPELYRAMRSATSSKRSSRGSLRVTGSPVGAGVSEGVGVRLASKYSLRLMVSLGEEVYGGSDGHYDYGSSDEENHHTD